MRIFIRPVFDVRGSLSSWTNTCTEVQVDPTPGEGSLGCVVVVGLLWVAKDAPWEILLGERGWVREGRAKGHQSSEIVLTTNDCLGNHSDKDSSSPRGGRAAARLLLVCRKKGD